MENQKEVVEDQEKVVIEIEDPVDETEEAFDTEGLLPEEIEMAKEQGLIKEEEEKEDGEHEEQPESETSEDTGEEEEEQEEVEEPSFEQVEAKEELLDKYNKNEKALYFRWKADKQKRQAAQKELDEMRSTSEFQQLKESVSAKKLAQINEALGSENLTVEQLQAIITGKEVDKEEPRYTMAEIEAMKKEEEVKVAQKQETINQRVALAEQIGKSKYDDFESIAKLAEEVVNSDTTRTYLNDFSNAVSNTDIDEDMIVEKVVAFAKLHPKFKDVTNKAAPEEQEKVNRAIKNSKKRVSSASLTSSGGRRAVNEEDLTVDDIPGMSDNQWNKLSRKTQERLLGKPS